MAEMHRGVVKWFNDAKGFGFIEHQSGRDVFVHYSVIESEGFKTLKDGEQVDYELKEGDKGLHAARVLRVITPGSEVTEQVDGRSNFQKIVSPIPTPEEALDDDDDDSDEDEAEETDSSARTQN